MTELFNEILANPLLIGYSFAGYYTGKWVGDELASYVPSVGATYIGAGAGLAGSVAFTMYVGDANMTTSLILAAGSWGVFSIVMPLTIGMAGK